MYVCRIHVKGNWKSKCSISNKTTIKLSQHDLKPSELLALTILLHLYDKARQESFTLVDLNKFQGVGFHCLRKKGKTARKLVKF